MKIINELKINFIKAFIISFLISSIIYVFLYQNTKYEITRPQTDEGRKNTQHNTNNRPSLSIGNTGKNISIAFNESLKKGEFEDAFFIAMDFLSASKREKHLKLLLSEWIQVDPSKHIIPFINQLNKQYQRDYIYIHIFNEWIKWDINTFDIWLIEKEKNSDFDLAIESAIRNNNEESLEFSTMIEWATKISNSEKRNQNVEYILKTWSDSNIEEAITWIEEDTSNHEYLPYLFKTLTKKDAREAIIALGLLDNNELATESLFSIYNTVSEVSTYEDVNQILAAVHFLSSDGLKEQIYELFLPKLLFNDISHITQVIDSIESEDTKSSLQRRIVSDWANVDPQATINYINTLPEGEDYSTILNDVISNWKNGDVFSADEWLSSLDHKNDIDSSASALAVAASVNKHTIHISLKWLNKIQDPRIKKDTMIDVVSWWNNYDKKSATDYLNSSNIDFGDVENIDLKNLITPSEEY